MPPAALLSCPIQGLWLQTCAIISAELLLQAAHHPPTGIVLQPPPLQLKPLDLGVVWEGSLLVRPAHGCSRKRGSGRSDGCEWRRRRSGSNFAAGIVLHRSTAPMLDHLSVQPNNTMVQL